MKKIALLTLFLVISCNVLSKSIIVHGREYELVQGTSEFVINQEDINIEVWGPFAIKEYQNGNFGMSKDMLEYLDKNKPEYYIASYYLGEIYSNIDIFKNQEKAVNYYLKFVNNENNKNVIKTQQAYIELSKLIEKEDDKLIYAHKAKEVRETKASLTNLYEIHKDLYNKTKKEEYQKKMKETLVQIRKFETPSYLNSVSFDLE